MQIAFGTPLKVPPTPTLHHHHLHHVKHKMFAMLLNNEHLTPPIKAGADNGDGGVVSWEPARRRDEQKILKDKPGALN